MTNKSYKPTMGHRSVTTKQAGEQMPMHVRYNTERGAGRRCCRKHMGVPRSSASLPRKPAQKRAMEPRKKCRERSVRIWSDSTSSSLCARIPFLPRLPPFIGYEGSHSALKSYLPYLTTSDLPMYLDRSCVREEPVPTLRSTDCACGRFSSRHPPPPNRASTGMRKLSWDGENRPNLHSSPVGSSSVSDRSSLLSRSPGSGSLS